jgi:hypothetical protein
MNANEKLIQDFYTAFQAKDGDRMASFYHAEALFSDPVFGSLHGQQIGMMWKMLCLRGRDLEITFDGVEADAHMGSVHWEARYTFSSTGRKVHNVIDASFLFMEGQILEHHDHFSLWRWSGMALGLLGLALGWTPLVQNRVRKQAREGLQAFIQKQAAA